MMLVCVSFMVYLLWIVYHKNAGIAMQKYL